MAKHHKASVQCSSAARHHRASAQPHILRLLSKTHLSTRVRNADPLTAMPKRVLRLHRDSAQRSMAQHHKASAHSSELLIARMQLAHKLLRVNVHSIAAQYHKANVSHSDHRPATQHRTCLRVIPQQM